MDISKINATVDESLSSVFPTWLIILLGILVSIFIIVGLYKIVAFRKINIVAKKMDYLVEDLIYKSEFMTPTIEALVKLSSYAELIGGIAKKNSDSLISYITSNQESVNKLSKQVKEVIRESK